MNKNLYRLIFNQARGMLMAVPDIASAGRAAGAVTAELMAPLIMDAMGWDRENLTEAQKQSISALITMAAGLIADNSLGVVTAAELGKNAVENNFLGNGSSEKRDELAEKIKAGDRTLQTNKQYLELENADQRSDELMAKFSKNPNEMSAGEKTELTYYLKVYAAEMSAQYGPDVAKALVTGLMTGESYLKSAPDSEAMQQAQTIMNTWGYHSTNASIGDPILLSGGNILGTTIKGAAANVAIGLTANAAVQLKGDEPFSYVDFFVAGTTALFTTGKGVGTSTAINVTGSLVGSQIKGEDPTGSAIGTTFGSVIGGVGGKMLNVVNPVKNQITKDIISTTTSSVASELTSEAIKSQVNERAKK